ncbi:MAG: class I SAM-dependent methyltransferase [Candidatus Brocadiaceae bacterium]|nr:class I SAM-dependent methyltransferase [Candidatus Brocadiaceae bacterium]
MRKQYKMMEWTDEKIMKFWNYKSQFQENYFAYQVGEAVVNRLHKYFLHAKNALDFGAGGGFLIPYLMSKGIEVSALDFSPDSIAVINNCKSN